MHEFSLMEDVIHTITDRLRTEGITEPGTIAEVKLRIGALDIHSEESFEQAFYVQAKGTPLEGAKLDLDLQPGHAKCEKCGQEENVGVDVVDGHDPMPVLECPRCGELCIVNGGRGVGKIDVIFRT
jgi:hydrogenase nickel incorporation protein HypA/HybF